MGPRDRAALVELLQHASFLEGLVLTSSRAQVLGSDGARESLAERYRALAAAAARLPKTVRERIGAPLEEVRRLAAADDAARWTGIRKVVRPLAAAVRAEVGDDPAAAFTLEAPPPGRKGKRTRPA